VKQSILFFSTLLAALFIAACGKVSEVGILQKQLDRYPEYTVILEDMMEEGNFFTDYYHKYKIVYADKVTGTDSLAYYTTLTDWRGVNKNEFKKYAPYLGMAVASKLPDGAVTKTEYPPGYQYVGDTRYGRWRTDSGGNSFWEFYGKFAFMQSMFNMFRGPVYRNDWDTYRDYRRGGRPYFGSNQQYGTSGSYTQKTHRSFFERRQARERSRKQSFGNKVKQRTRRSRMSGFRSRSGGSGK
jgi:hypothetical protein